MDNSLQALADPRRREIVELLLKKERGVGDLARQLPIAQSGVSRHLRILKDAGMVESRTEGQRRIYSLRAEPFEKLSEWLAQYRRLWENRLDQFELELERRTAGSGVEGTQDRRPGSRSARSKAERAATSTQPKPRRSATAPGSETPTPRRRSAKKPKTRSPK